MRLASTIAAFLADRLVSPAGLGSAGRPGPAAVPARHQSTCFRHWREIFGAPGRAGGAQHIKPPRVGDDIVRKRPPAGLIHCAAWVPAYRPANPGTVPLRNLFEYLPQQGSIGCASAETNAKERHLSCSSRECFQLSGMVAAIRIGHCECHRHSEAPNSIGTASETVIEPKTAAMSAYQRSIWSHRQRAAHAAHGCHRRP